MNEKQRIAFKPREIAELTGLSRSFVYQLIQRGDIRPVRLGRAILIPATEIERLLESKNPANRG
jgi:excisionase family DNA binding protein